MGRAFFCVCVFFFCESRNPSLLRINQRFLVVFTGGFFACSAEPPNLMRVHMHNLHATAGAHLLLTYRFFLLK